MNYEQARQIGQNGPAPGKWNWTNFNDGIQAEPFTVAPCAWPDYERPSFDPITLKYENWAPTGRERCDHDTQDAAERHHHDWEFQRAALTLIDLDTVPQRNRCDLPGCPNWATFTIRWAHNAWLHDELCDEHADDPTALHPFVAGARTIHS